MCDDRKELAKIIEEAQIKKWEDKLPPKFKQNITTDYTNFILSMTDDQLVKYHQNHMENHSPGNPFKLAGIIVILAVEAHELMKELIKKRETNQSTINKATNWDLYYTTIYCAEKYDMPQDVFESIMKLRYFRNFLAHDLKVVLGTGLREASTFIGEGISFLLHLKGEINRTNF